MQVSEGCVDDRQRDTESRQPADGVLFETQGNVLGCGVNAMSFEQHLEGQSVQTVRYRGKGYEFITRELLKYVDQKFIRKVGELNCLP